jgi:hypothetical protein
MKLLRLLQLSAILAVGLGMSFAPAHAGTNAPGTYDVSISYIPGISVPGGLPDCVDKFDRQTYVGKLTVSQDARGGYKVTFVGENQDDSSLNLRASADFGVVWNGFTLGALGGRDDAIVSIDAASLISGRIVGRVLGENGHPGHLVARIGPGGVVESCRFNGRGSK